jgi:hypothetical protein
MSKGTVYPNVIIGVCDNLISAFLVKGYLQYVRPNIFEPTEEGRAVLGKMFNADGNEDHPKG